jgi:hypothetical protein
MSDKEIEDPAHYVKLDVKKIEAVNGLLQLVQQNQLKADRAEIIKQKYWTTKSSPQITKIRRKQCSPNKNIQETLSGLALLTSFCVFLCPFQTGVESSTLISLFSLLDSDLRIYVQPLPVSLCLRGDSTMKLWSWLINLR